ESMHAVVARIGTGDVIEAVAVIGIEGDARRERVADWQVHCALEAEIIVIAGRSHDVAMIAAANFWVARSDEHRAARRVLTDEGALRAAQNLNARDVVVRLALEIAREGRDTVAIG